MSTHGLIFWRRYVLLPLIFRGAWCAGGHRGFFHREYNKLLGTDDVHARETGSDKINAKSHSWQSWENLFALKKAIEVSGWKQKKDDQGAIEALEGLAKDNSLGFVQGTKVLRKEDHSGMIDCYISRIENDEFHVKRRSPRRRWRLYSCRVST